MKRIVFVTTLAFLLGGYAIAQQKVTSPEYRFSIDLPEDWTREPLRSDFEDTRLRVASPDGIEEAALYVQIFKAGRFSPESYRSAARKYITDRMEGTILAENEIRLGDHTAWQVEYEGNSVDYVEEQRHFLNTVVFDDGKIYVVHGAARSPKWDEVRDELKRSSLSFRVGEVK